MTPPFVMPGYDFAGLIGQGALADVFLYTRTEPRGAVAAKVLRLPVSGEALRLRFEAEAALLVSLSAQHPSIVTVHSAWVAPDGRPCLILEHCSRPSLAQAAARAPLAAPLVLQTMIRLAGALESAHRVGVLHRDIRPANVLTTDWGMPALSDFGLAALGGAQSAQAGISLPWTAPETLLGEPFTPQADLYSLAATAYTVLAGRSPFEDARAGDPAALANRIVAAAVPPIGRPDVPPSLEQSILQALARDQAQRTQTPADFAIQLQQIEQELGLPITPLDVREAEGEAFIADETVVASHGADPAFDETILVARRADADGVETPGVTDAPDDATVLVSRSPAPAFDATVQVVRTLPGETDGTASDEEDAPDDATILVRRAGAEDSAAPTAEEPPDDATVLAGRRQSEDPDDSTQLIAATQTPAGTPSSMPSVSRKAYSPGEEGVAQRVYGIRAQAAPEPVVRRAPVPRAAPGPVQRSRRRSAGVGAIVLALSGLILLAGAVVGIVVLAGM